MKQHTFPGYTMRILATAITCSVAIPAAVRAQSGAVSSGGDASGAGGTVSFSVGQPVFTTVQGSTGTNSQGVQQAYEIYAYASIDEAVPAIVATVFPNPAVDYLTLSVDAADLSGLSYRLVDTDGRILTGEALSASETSIPMMLFASGTYYLEVFGNGRVKHFKIIKQ